MQLRHTSQPALALAAFIAVTSAISGSVAGDLITSGRSAVTAAAQKHPESLKHPEGPLGDTLVLGTFDDQQTNPTGGPGQQKNQDLGWQAATNQDDPTEFNIIAFGMDMRTSKEGPGGFGDDARSLDRGFGGMFGAVSIELVHQLESPSPHWSELTIDPVFVRDAQMPSGEIPAPGSTVVLGFLAIMLLNSRSRRT